MKRKIKIVLMISILLFLITTNPLKSQKKEIIDKSKSKIPHLTLNQNAILFNPLCCIIPCSEPQKMYRHNADSVAIDTCGLVLKPNDFCDILDDYSAEGIYFLFELKAEKRYFAKKEWVIVFPDSLIKSFSNPSDSIIYISYNDFNPKFTEIINFFKELENEFGNYNLFTTKIVYNSSPPISYYLHFENYVNAVIIEDKINKLPGTWCYFKNYFALPLDVIDENNIITRNSKKIIFDDYIIIEQSELKSLGTLYFRIYDINGDIVKSGNFQNALNFDQVRIDLVDIIPGVYFLILDEYNYFIILKRS